MVSSSNQPNLSKACPSELRFDPVSKDWVVIATGRARRPETFAREKRQKHEESKEKCPFCNIKTQEKPTLALPKNHKRNWQVIVIPNKYPAFGRCRDLDEKRNGSYRRINGVGFHEVVVTRDHKKQIAQFLKDEVRNVIDAYHERYLDLMNEKLVSYISIFHNHGKEAGASLSHPHSQIIAMPLIDPDLRRSLQGSYEYHKKHRRCVHCVMLEYDRKDGRRIIFENKDFIAVAPFASRIAFEVRIYPRKHRAYFERITDSEKDCLAECLKEGLSRLYKALDDPAYNFFIHTAPCDGRNYDHYHWHVEILPKTSTWAGFELGTGIEISTIEPETAAEFLRKQ